MRYQIAGKTSNFNGMLTSVIAGRSFVQFALCHHFLLLERWLAQLCSLLPVESPKLDFSDELYEWWFHGVTEYCKA